VGVSEVDFIAPGDDGVCEVVLNRPATGNSLNPTVPGAIVEAIAADDAWILER